MNFSVITTQFWSLVLQGLALGLIYSLVALGYTMVYGVLRLINFANSEVFMLGTFAVLWVEIEVLGHPVTAKPLAGFELVYAPKREDPIVVINGSGSFTSESKGLLNRAKPGDAYYFNNVRARCPGDVTSRKINSLVFQIK